MRAPSSGLVVAAVQRMTTNSGTNIPGGADEECGRPSRRRHTHTTRASKPVATAARAHGELHMQLRERERETRERQGRQQERKRDCTRARHREEAPEVVVGRFEPGALLRRQY